MNRLLAVLTVSVALVAGCGGSNSHKYPSQIHDNFMKSCSDNSGGGASADKICQCSFDALQKKYTAKQFTALEDSISKGGSADELIAIVTKCAQQN